MELTICEATEKDLPAILALHAQLELGNLPTLSIGEAEKVLRRFKDYPDYHLFVAILAGEVIGTFALLVMDNLAHLGAPSGIVEDVVVSENMQRKGIGREMMEFAMRVCKEKGCYKLMLSSNMRREAAHQFYESLGFERHGYSFSIDLKD